MFLFREFLKLFVFSKKIRVGFVLCVFPSPYYGRIMASARLRAYDVINNFNNDENYFLELYKPWKKYDIVIFQKKFDNEALKLAKKLKLKGTKVVLDINVNYYDKSALEKTSLCMNKQIIEFTKVADSIISSSEYLKNYIRKMFPEKKIAYIPENITDNFFLAKKKIKEKEDNLKLIYVGYAIKAKEILNIRNVLRSLRKTHNFNIVFICERNPEISINGIETEFIKYKQRKIHKQMSEGDIFIAPRNLNDSYNLGHSFTKIGYPMSVGIPIVASKIPSYEKSPALLCENKEEWKNRLEELLSNFELRKKIGNLGIEFCKSNYSSKSIKRQYIDFFEEVNK